MKSILGIFTLLFCTIVILSCSVNTPNKHEQLYTDTADSLKLYKDLSFVQSQMDSVVVMKDYLSLTFEEFKKKHNADDLTIDAMSTSLQTTMDIAKTFQLIEENMFDIDSMMALDVDSTITDTTYSFNHIKEIGNHSNVDSLIEILLMMVDSTQNEN